MGQSSVTYLMDLIPVCGGEFSLHTTSNAQDMSWVSYKSTLIVTLTQAGSVLELRGGFHRMRPARRIIGSYRFEIKT